jgi:hypothetical protein
MKVEALTEGWHRTLENIDNTYQHVTRAQFTAFEYCDARAADQAYKHIENFASMAVHDGICEFEQVARKFIS